MQVDSASSHEEVISHASDRVPPAEGNMPGEPSRIRTAGTHGNQRRENTQRKLHNGGLGPRPKLGLKLRLHLPSVVVAGIQRKFQARFAANILVLSDPDAVAGGTGRRLPNEECLTRRRLLDVQTHGNQ
jgi:hypothetical protein